jgi:hypothetical protein
VAALVVGIVLNGGREKGVDEGRLSQSRLSGNLIEASLAPARAEQFPRTVEHTIIVKAAPRFATILWLYKLD